MQKFFLVFVFIIANLSFATEPTPLIKDKYFFKLNNSERIYEIEYPYNKNNSDIIFYRAHYEQANPFIPYPSTVMKDTKKVDKQIIYSEIYHTGLYGLRLTKNKNTKAPQHLIFSGDSNMFGIGVKDEETFPNRIGLKINSHTVYNFGLAGTGPNSALYFLQHFDVKKVLKNQVHGIFMYDFHHYLFERIIGSKAFIAWGKSSPRYAIENGNVVYKGTFEKYWLAIFYSFLNKLPYNQMLFPNIPRISESHIEFAAKLFAQMKAEYLKQTDRNNRFIVIINPKYLLNFPAQKIQFFVECLKKEGIETLSFTQNEVLPMPQIPIEGHLNNVAHENYSLMLMKKMNFNE